MTDQPQSSYMQYLPAIFHKEPGQDNEIPLSEYLVPFEAGINQFDHLLSTLDRYFAPELAPADTFLSWLATWVALPLDEEWEEDQQRRLVREAVALYRWRGTVYGMKRYLELYAGVPQEQIAIDEAHWPAGMQIGVASRIGRKRPITDPGTTPTLETTERAYYVVSTQTPTSLPPGFTPADLPDGTALRFHYPVATVEQVDIEENGVRIRYKAPAAHETISLFHPRPASNLSEPNIARLHKVVDYHYRREANTGPPNGEGFEYDGGTFLIDRVPSAYRFIVHVEIPEEIAQEQAAYTRFPAKLQNVLNLEKPAHTDYYLKVSSAKRTPVLEWMRVEVRSNIGLDTTIG